MIRILIATGIYPPDSGGPATYSKLLNDKLPDYGFDVKVLSFSDFKYLPKFIRHLVYFFATLKKGIKTDIIYAQDPVSVGLPAMFASKILRKKFILKIVGDYAWEQGSQRFEVTDLLDEFSKKNNYGFQVRFFKFIQTFVAKQAIEIIVPSYYLKKIVSNWGINRKKIRVIYNAFRKPQISESKTDLKKILNLYGTTIVSVGRLVPWKGFLTLVGVIPEIIKKFPNVKLLIIDDGPDREKIENLIKHLNLYGSVKMLGRLNHQTTLRYIKASDIFVLNTSYEGFSHLILESMAVGTPVVTTSVGGNVEAIKNREEGLLFEYNNARQIKESLIEMIRDDILAQNFAKKAQKKVEQYKEGKMLKELSRELSRTAPDKN